MFRILADFAARDFRVVKFVLAQTRPSTRLSRSAVPISYVAPRLKCGSAYRSHQQG